jgi:hypothetical protein
VEVGDMREEAQGRGGFEGVGVASVEDGEGLG